MQSWSDAQLLGDYAEKGAEAAFSELVMRHTGLVYSAALRQVDSPDLAREVAQEVFIALARNARALAASVAHDASLAGWLCRCARNVALNHRRAELRRLSRERLAMDVFSSSPVPEVDWERLRLVLDDAMSDLNEADYDALVLRFYQNQDYRAVGRALGVSDDTAQKRVTRALEKLHAHLSRRGVAATSAVAVGAALSAHAVVAAPAGMAVTLCSAALGAAAATGSVATISTTITAAAATKAIAMTALQKTFVAAALAASVGTAIFATHQNSTHRTELRALQQAQAARDARLAQLESDNERLTRAAAASASSSNAPASEFRELLNLRGKAQLDAREIAELKAILARNSGKIPEPVAQIMNRYLSASIEQEKQWQRAAAQARAKRLATKLGIEPGQEPALRNVLLATAESRAQLEMAHNTGTVGPDTITPEMITTDESRALASVLTPEQMAAYSQLTTNDMASNNRAWVSFETGKMKKELNLTQEQAEQVSAVLARLKPGEGGQGTTYYANAREQMEIRMRALDQILTPQQSATYRQIKEERMVEKAQIASIVNALKK